jgi:hypothetical protein
MFIGKCLLANVYWQMFIGKCLLANIKFVSNYRQVGGFLRVLRFPPSIKLTATI